jgi:hypothetical protein
MMRSGSSGSVLLLGGTNAQVEVGRGLDRMRVSDFARAVVVEVVADYHGFLSGVTVLGLVGKAQFPGTSKLRSVAKRFWSFREFSAQFPEQ